MPLSWGVQTINQSCWDDQLQVGTAELPSMVMASFVIENICFLVFMKLNVEYESSFFFFEDRNIV